MSTNFLVNGLYPLEYFTVEGVDQIQYPNAYFWASRQRFASVDASGVRYDKNGTPTSEFLELDLGRVREISYMNFSIVRGPIDVTICYDALSATDGTHRWVEVTPLPNESFDSALHYNSNTKSAFHNAEFYFTDNEGRVINTRFIRIEFARRDVEWPHKGAAPFQWPIVVKSLRTARFVDTYHRTMGIIFDAGISPDDDANKVNFAITDANIADPGFTVGDDFVCQQFGLPSDFKRGDISPTLLGISTLIYVAKQSFDTPDNLDTVGIAWELWSAPADTREFTKLRAGVKHGVTMDERVWITVFFSGTDPVLTDFNTTIYEWRIKTLTAHIDGDEVLTQIMTADNNVPGYVLPGTSTWTAAGNGASPAAGSSTVTFTEDVDDYLQPGDVIQRYDRLGGVQATVQSVSGPTVTLTAPYQGTSVTGAIGMRVLSLRLGVDADQDVARSLCMRVYGDVGDTGRDVLGNFYRYATRRDKATGIKDTQSAGWYCEPQPATNAVESLYMDTRWSDENGNHPAVIDAIRIVPRTPGVLMHVYYSTDHLNSQTPHVREVWDNLIWNPIHTTYELKGRMTITLPTTIRANFLKLEFTNLQPQPFDLPARPQHPAVQFHRYPTWIENQFSNALIKRVVQDWFTKAANKGIVKLNVLKTMTSPIQEFQYKEREFLAALATNKKFDKTAINSGLINQKTNTFIDPTTGSQISLSTTAMYQSPLQLTVDKSSVLGQAIAVQQAPTLRTAVREGGFNVSRSIAPFVSTAKNRINESFAHLAETPMWFNQTCRHVYKIDQAKFNKKAYFVGIQSVELLRKDYTVARDETIIVENLWDDQNLQFNTWLRDNPSQLAVLLESQEEVNVLVSYVVDGISYTDEPQTFSTDLDGSFTPVTLVNAGLAQAINIVVWQQNDAGGRGSVQFYLGRDFTQDHVDDGFGNLTNILTPDVSGNRLVVEHVSDNFDAATVTGKAIISGEEEYVPA